MSRLPAFSHLSSDVKQRLQLELRPCTLIIGGNATYKTAVHDAIRLALTGKHRIGPHPSDLIELAMEPMAGLSVSLQSAAGNCNFVLPIGGEGNAKKPEWTFEGELSHLTKEERLRILPSEAVKDLIDFGPARAREAVLKRFGPQAAAIPLPLGLDEGQQALWWEGVGAAQEEYGKEAPASTILAGVSAWMRRAKTAKSKEAGVLEARVAQGRAAVALDGGGAEVLPELRRQRDEAREWERTALDRQRLKQSLVDIEPKRAELAKLQERHRLLAVSFEEWHASLPGLRDQAFAKVAAIQAELAKEQEGFFFGTRLVGLYAGALAEDPTNATCPFCGGQGRPLEHQHKEYSGHLERRRQSIQRTTTRLAEAQAAMARLDVELATEERRRRLELTSAQQGMAAVTTAIAHHEGASTELARRVSAPYTGRPSVELHATIERIEKAAAARATLEAEATRYRQLERQSEDATTLEKEAMVLAATSLRQAAETAAATITKYMGDGRRCEVKVDETHWEWCSVGVDGRAHRQGGASGSEWASLALALPIAWTEGNPLRVALYDDSDLGCFDRTRLLAFLEALRQAVERGDLTQAIVIWNRPDEIRAAMPPGWHVIIRDPQPTI